MSHLNTPPRIAALALLAATTLAANAADLVINAGSASPVRVRAMTDFKSVHNASHFAMHSNDSISRVYGRAFSHGDTTLESTQQFIDQHSDIWGIDGADLLPEGPFDDRRHTLPIGYIPETDSYKFTGTYFTQTLGGIPVFRSKLVLLTRNEPGNPLVLASAQLHDLSSFEIDPQLAALPVDEQPINRSAKQAFNDSAFVTNAPERVIYAGTANNPHAPTIADVAEISVNGFEKYLIVTDVATGDVVYSESLIHTIDISGNASAIASDGPGSDNCEAEVLQPLPYLSVGVQGGNSVFADANGDFTIPHGGSGSVNVNATLDGRWFDVFDLSSTSVEDITINTTPPGPVNFVFNQSNASQFSRAQVNSYVEANRVRDMAIGANPSYPTLNNLNFPIYVNQTGGLCPGNAWYDGSSINFCTSGSGYPNTAWSSVVHHEYGHHLVSAGGSGQGQYGEGMGDVMSTIILDDPRLGVGFFGSCSGSLRNAENQRDYPCSGGIHDCGQLISGCVWDTRNELVNTEPDDYLDILAFLSINSILVHSGDLITPQITIDWLTLDDDDSDIGNGTPHYFEINGGFSAHNMDAPPLTLVDIQPVGLPDYANPNGGTTVVAEFTNVAGTLDPASPTLMVDTGSGFQPVAMTMTNATTYQANIPGSGCGSEVRFYFTAETNNGFTQNEPASAPNAYYSVISAFDAPLVSFDDNFESDTGWSVSGAAANSGSGRWERAIPSGDGSRADAPNDFDGSGRCYITGNGGPGSNTDVDAQTILTSPVMDASGASIISYARWFNNSGNSAVDDQFVVQVSDNAGGSWTGLETLGVNHPESNGGWFAKQFAISDIAGFTANDQFRIRFIADDSGSGSIVECGIDAVTVQVVDCDVCPADLNADGALDFFDVSAFLSAFNAGDPAADFNGDGNYNFFDVSAFLGAFSAGCP